jgi:hypothetical protein
MHVVYASGYDSRALNTHVNGDSRVLNTPSGGIRGRAEYASGCDSRMSDGALNVIHGRGTDKSSIFLSWSQS